MSAAVAESALVRSDSFTDAVTSGVSVLDPAADVAHASSSPAAAKDAVIVDVSSDDLGLAPYDPMAAAKELASATGGNSLLFKANARQQVTLSFSELKYSVTMKDKSTRDILKGCSGEARPGQVLAIMGSSGAGKTTLLNLLAGRLESANNAVSQGQVLVNGQKRDMSSFRQLSAYVLQDDLLYAELSVRETIMFSAHCRLPRSMSAAEKTARVDAIIAELGLSSVEDTLVGNELVRGISGGQRKRVNIAVELVSDPSIIFLDEPTSGLDSFNAQNAMSSLARLAANGRTVITNIHQPRSSIFQMFDQLLLLSDGLDMYFGPALDIVPYLARLGYPCPADFNPADFFIDLVSLDRRSPALAESSTTRVKALAAAYRRYRTAAAAAAGKTGGSKSLQLEAAPASQEESAVDAAAAPVAAVHHAHDLGKFATPWLHQCWLLSKRCGLITMRDRLNNFSMLGQTIIFSVILSLIWLKAGVNLHGKDVQSIAGALFFIAVNQSFGSMFGIIFQFPVERGIVLKERASRTYHVGAYFLSKSVVEAPRTMLLAALFAIVTYPSVSLRAGFDHFILYWVILSMVAFAAQGIAYIVSAMASNPQQAGAIAPVLVVNSMLFAGFFIGTNQIPVFLSWLRYLSFLKYSFSLLMQNEFMGRTLSTECDDMSFCLGTGDAVLDLYGVNELSYAANFFILLGFIVGMRLIAYLILLRRGPKFDDSL